MSTTAPPTRAAAPAKRKGRVIIRFVEAPPGHDFAQACEILRTIGRRVIAAKESSHA